METVWIAKADALPGQSVEDTCIMIASGPLNATRMDQDAKEIAHALHGVLPQGTWARLVGVVATLWAKDNRAIISPPDWHEQE
jgi:hypothetical protein